MMTKIQQYGLDKLNRDELVELRDDIDAEIECFEAISDPERERIEALIMAGEIRELTVEQALDLEARLKRAEENPDSGIPWEEALARLRARK